MLIFKTDHKRNIRTKCKAYFNIIDVVGSYHH